MYDISKIQNCFKTIIGWKNSPDTDITQITDADLLTSDSGRYYGEFHPLLTTDTITQAISESADLEVYLRQKTDSAIVKLINKLANKKKEMQSTKTLLNSSIMFDGIARFNNTIVNESKFVGFRIKLKRSYGVKVTIDKLGLQFSNTQTGLPIYLFHTSQVDPIQTVTATTVKAKSLEWLVLDSPIDLSYYNDLYDAGGEFYLGYYQDDILGQALKKDFDWTRFCGSCKGTNAAKIWNTRMDFMQVRPIYVASGNFTPFEMFDYHDTVFTDSNNYGLNFATSIKCDLSSYFCENKTLFTEAIGMQVAVDILNDIKHSDRSNRIVEVNRNMIIRDLEGDKETFEHGMTSRLMKEIDSLDFDFSMIDSPCLPESKKYGVRVTTV